MNQKILTKTKVISKISVDSNFTFTSYDYEVMRDTGIAPQNTVLNSPQREFMGKLLLFHTEMISA